MLSLRTNSLRAYCTWTDSTHSILRMNWIELNLVIRLWLGRIQWPGRARRSTAIHQISSRTNRLYARYRWSHCSPIRLAQHLCRPTPAFACYQMYRSSFQTTLPSPKSKYAPRKRRLGLDLGGGGGRSAATQDQRNGRQQLATSTTSLELWSICMLADSLSISSAFSRNLKHEAI